MFACGIGDLLFFHQYVYEIIFVLDLLKLNFYNIVWSRQQEALVSTWTQIKEFTCFNQNGVLFSLNGKTLKLVDQFKYIGSNISSTESDINIRADKA